MADLSDDRGQLVLLAAFILAATFVILALVVNSAIFTENLSTRDEVPGSQEALEYRDEVEKSVGSALMAINQNNSVDWEDDRIEEFAERGGFDQSALGRVVNLEEEDDTPGIKIAQDGHESRNFTSSGFDQNNWNLADGVEKTRNVQMNITEIRGEFEFILEGSGGNTWGMTVKEDNNNAEITVNPPNSGERTCVREDWEPNVHIDVTAGTVDGYHCPGLSRTSDGTAMWFGTDIDDPYEIRFEGGNNVNGTYSLIVDGDANQDTTNLVDEDDQGHPYYWDGDVGDEGVPYSVMVEYEYTTPNVKYETNIRVAPGEVRDG